MRNPPPTPTYPEAKPATSPMRAPQANCFADMETGRCASGSDADSPEAGAHAEPAGEEAAASAPVAVVVVGAPAAVVVAAAQQQPAQQERAQVEPAA